MSLKSARVQSLTGVIAEISLSSDDEIECVDASNLDQTIKRMGYKYGIPIPAPCVNKSLATMLNPNGFYSLHTHDFIGLET